MSHFRDPLLLFSFYQFVYMMLIQLALLQKVLAMRNFSAVLYETCDSVALELPSLLCTFENSTNLPKYHMIQILF